GEGLVADRRSPEHDLIDVVPVRPINVELQIPLFRGSERHAAHDKLGEPNFGGCWSPPIESGRKKGRLNRGVPGIVQRGKVAIAYAERPLLVRLPAHARIEPIVGVVAFKPELVLSAQTGGQNALLKRRLGIVYSGANPDGEGGKDFPRDDRIDAGVQ